MAKKGITIKKGIKKSVFKRKSYSDNNFSMSVLRGKGQKPSIYIYHMFDDGKEKSWNRWYDTNFLEGKFKLNDKKRTLTYIIPKWENDTGVRFYVSKNVPIVIYFTVKGWDKFTKTFNDFWRRVRA